MYLIHFRTTPSFRRRSSIFGGGGNTTPSKDLPKEELEEETTDDKIELESVIYGDVVYLRGVLQNKMFGYIHADKCFERVGFQTESANREIQNFEEVSFTHQSALPVCADGNVDTPMMKKRAKGNSCSYT